MVMILNIVCENRKLIFQRTLVTSYLCSTMMLHESANIIWWKYRIIFQGRLGNLRFHIVPIFSAYCCLAEYVVTEDLSALKTPICKVQVLPWWVKLLREPQILLSNNITYFKFVKYNDGLDIIPGKCNNYLTKPPPHLS